METKFTLACGDSGEWSVGHDEWRNTAFRALLPSFDPPLMKGEVIVFVAEGFNRDIESAIVGDKADVIFSRIAAAQDLYEALKYARRFLRAQDHDVAYVDAVLAKARGE